MPPDVSPDATETPLAGEPSIAGSTTASVSATLPPVREGEVTLVERGAINNNVTKQTLSHSKSFDESLSNASLRSATSRGSAISQRSDADRLIDAIQTPLGIGEPESESTSSQRRNSKSAYYRSNTKSVSRSMSPNRPSGRPSGPLRSPSSPNNVADAEVGVPASDTVVGMEYITDSKTPIRPVKVPDEYKDQPERPAQPSETSGVVFEVGESAVPSKSSQYSHSYAASNATTADGSVQLADKPKSAKLQVLVAEDDPINMKILRKRLEKAGHTVHHTVNGEDCALAYRGSDGKYDVVLMDMQVCS